LNKESTEINNMKINKNKINLQNVNYYVIKVITLLTPSWTKKYDGSWEHSICSIAVFWRRKRSLRYRL